MQSFPLRFLAKRRRAALHPALVAREQITVNDSLAVRFVDGFSRIADELHLFRQAQPGKRSFQRLSIDKLHRDVGLAFDFADFVDLADRGMIDASLGAGFPLKARHHLGIAAANELECDDAL